jgi:hypothetical protein
VSCQGHWSVVQLGVEHGGRNTRIGRLGRLVRWLFAVREQAGGLDAGFCVVGHNVDMNWQHICAMGGGTVTLL